MKVSEIVKITHGKLLSGNPDTDIDPSKILTDSRTAGKGSFFIALTGPNFNGNNFVEPAFEKGAVGAIITRREASGLWSGKVIILVKDSTKALQDIASAHRKKFKIPVIAVTGSNGKTTVKEMIATCLSKKYHVLKNEGTKNNHIGVPQTILQLKPIHEACVLELGTNHKGEIRNLSAIARPTVAVITNVGPSHLEFLGDLDGVYGAKKEIIDFLDKKGILVLNGDDQYLSRIKDKTHKVLRYGFGASNDIVAEGVLPPRKGRITFVVNNSMIFELNLMGRHNIYNALAAITVAGCFKISHRSIREALHEYRPASRRLDVQKIGGIDIIDDSYNSNPLSMMSALEAIKHYPANARWIVAGDMLELGKKSVHFHKMIGKAVAKSDVDGLLTFGKLSRHILSQAMALGMRKDRLWHCPTHDDIAGVLKKFARKGDVILLKGSRSMKMEEVLAKLKGSK